MPRSSSSSRRPSRSPPRRSKYDGRDALNRDYGRDSFSFRRDSERPNGRRRDIEREQQDRDRERGERYSDRERGKDRDGDGDREHRDRDRERYGNPYRSDSRQSGGDRSKDHLRPPS